MESKQILIGVFTTQRLSSRVGNEQNERVDCTKTRRPKSISGPLPSPRLSPLLIIEQYDDEEPLKDGNKVNQEVHCMGNVIDVTCGDLFNDDLCIVQNVGAHKKQAAIKREAKGDEPARKDGDEIEQKQAPESCPKQATQKQIGPPLCEQGADRKAHKDTNGARESDKRDTGVRGDNGERDEGAGGETGEEGEEVEEVEARGRVALRKGEEEEGGEDEEGGDAT